jgi:hypothetical protein
MSRLAPRFFLQLLLQRVHPQCLLFRAPICECPSSILIHWGHCLLDACQFFSDMKNHALFHLDALKLLVLDFGPCFVIFLAQAGARNRNWQQHRRRGEPQRFDSVAICFQ